MEEIKKKLMPDGGMKKNFYSMKEIKKMMPDRGNKEINATC